MSDKTDNQLSFFDSNEPPEAIEPTEEVGKECRFLNDNEHHWWSSRNTNLCSKSYDCSHCHIERPMELNSNPIRKRGRCSVFYCKRVKTEYENYTFKHKCEITGNEWEGKPWNSHEDYNTHPINTPCKFCDLPTCENCVFYKEVSDKHPYGCCGSCGHKLYCSASKYDKSVMLSIDEFLRIARDKEEMDGYIVDFTKGPLKKSYQSSCPYYNGYLCNGSHSQTLCKGTEIAIKNEIFRCVCERNHEICPIFKNLSDENYEGSETT